VDGHNLPPIVILNKHADAHLSVWRQLLPIGRNQSIEFIGYMDDGHIRPDEPYLNVFSPKRCLFRSGREDLCEPYEAPINRLIRLTSSVSLNGLRMKAV
jgi:hypothetical protein